MNSIKSVDEIINISDSFKTPDKMAYKYIVRQVDKLIRSRAIEHQDDATFQVPAVVMFQPYFNRDRVTKKIAQHYTSMGFFCNVTDNYTINIRWRKEKQQEEDETEKDGKGFNPKNNNETEEEESSSDDHDESGTDEAPQEDSSSEEELPKRKIIVRKPESFTSLSKRVAEMKK